MLATIVYAINPKSPDTPVEGFVSFSKSEDNALKRKVQIEAEIASGGWKHWGGEERRYFIERCNQNGWGIHTKLCAIINS